MRKKMEGYKVGKVRGFKDRRCEVGNDFKKRKGNKGEPKCQEFGD